MIIYSHDHAAYDFSRSQTPQVPEDLPTVYRMLKFQEFEHVHTVSNVVLDMTAAERILLVNVSTLRCLHFATIILSNSSVVTQ